MTVNRLRAAHSGVELQQMYATPHDHRRYGRGHAERVQAMMDLIAGLTWKSAADLSCGNGAVLDSTTARFKHYGDFAPGYPIEGPIEETILSLTDVDLFIMGETLEHLEDPGAVLGQVARRASWILLSTPIEAWDDSNAEHYWAWDREGVEELLRQAAGEFNVVSFVTVDSREYGEPYCYGIWLIEL